MFHAFMPYYTNTAAPALRTRVSRLKTNIIVSRYLAHAQQILYITHLSSKAHAPLIIS